MEVPWTRSSLLLLPSPLWRITTMIMSHILLGYPSHGPTFEANGRSTFLTILLVLFLSRMQIRISTRRMRVIDQSVLWISLFGLNVCMILGEADI